ncbi:MAG: LysM peptidoglycan-binding domain-containing protein [Candidatus Marinimicrobia bacterium]|nr:LysM peptidoglycan-binding domain-containing protein [Candidatus Neomarinimicrobiota bacterium]
MKYYKIAILTLAGTFLLAGCASEAVDQGPSPTAEEPTPAPVEDVAADDAMTMDEPEAADMESSLGDNNEAVAEAPISRDIPRNDYQDIEQLPPGSLPQDSVAYAYIIRPDDYLTKIAFKEYGNPNAWRKIYQWNRTRIGDDPARIFPYRELQLYKPAAEVTETSFEYLVHTVVSGENLWAIAGSEYKDERAWIVIFWDNEELLTQNEGLLKPGMELRIRTRLW